MTEDLLREALRDRADQTAYQPTPLGEVVAAARTIRRRRRTTRVLVAAAAVVAITVPIAVVANRAEPDSAPVGPGPSEPVVIPEGTPPLIAYSVDGEIINPDGTQVTPTAGLEYGGQFTPYQGGYLLASAYEGFSLTRVDADGVAGQGDCSGGIAVSLDGATTAWSTTPCLHGSEGTNVIHRGPTNGSDDDEETQEVEQYRPHVVGLIGDEVVYNEIGRGAWITDLINEPRPIPGLESVTGVASDEGLVAGQATGSLKGVVVDVETGAVLWEAEDTSLGKFSSDGHHVLGAIEVSHRGGCCTRVILDAATGEVVARLPQSSSNDFPTLGEVVWEDDTHLLGSRSHNSAQAIIRFDLEGHGSLALDWQTLTGPPDVVFALRP